MAVASIIIIVLQIYVLCRNHNMNTRLICLNCLDTIKFHYRIWEFLKKNRGSTDIGRRYNNDDRSFGQRPSSDFIYPERETYIFITTAYIELFGINENSKFQSQCSTPILILRVQSRLALVDT